MSSHDWPCYVTTNWWRGYTDDDMRMVIQLMTGSFLLGSVVYMTKGQFKAWHAYKATKPGEVK